MRGLVQTVALGLLVLTSLPGLAQRVHTSKTLVPAAHLLDKTLGESVVDAALNTSQGDYTGSDCSHFVNAIFEAVGLPFRYTNSIALYKGTESFHRVLHPQPGDLIVWQGHVGIVVDPEEHSFYSMLRSGLKLASYDSHYWRARGHARFLRYANPIPVHLASTRVHTDDGD